MSLELELPFEFVVFGIPISAQASAGSRDAWKRRVRAAAGEQAAPDYWATSEPLHVIIVYFSLGPPTIDVDNMAKPILDALTGSLWSDDRQVHQLTVRKTDRTLLAGLSAPSPNLAAALTGEEPFVYVSIRPMTRHEELPE